MSIFHSDLQNYRSGNAAFVNPHPPRLVPSPFFFIGCSPDRCPVPALIPYGSVPVSSGSYPSFAAPFQRKTAFGIESGSTLVSLFNCQRQINLDLTGYFPTQYGHPVPFCLLSTIARQWWPFSQTHHAFRLENPRILSGVRSPFRS